MRPAKDPWASVCSKPGVLSADDASRLDFVKGMGARDYTVTAVFDGRSKSWRKHLEENMADQSHLPASICFQFAFARRSFWYPTSPS